MNPDGDRGQREPDALIGSVIAVTIRASGQTYRAQQILCRRTVTGTVRFWLFLSPDFWRSSMKFLNPSIPTCDTETASVIFISVELSKKSWLAAIHTPLADKVGLHKVEAGDSTELLALVRRVMKKVERTMSGRVKVMSCYEAGYDGFWLHRVLVEAGLINHVIDPASLQVNRRADGPRPTALMRLACCAR